METVKFEGLELELNISKVMFSLGNIDIYWYGFFILLGITVALIFCKIDNHKYNIKFEDILLLAIFLIPISILFARAYYVVFKIDYYLKHVNEIINLRNGGLAIYGGIIGAVLTIFVYCKVKKIKVLDMFDFIAPYLALGQAIGRWGNFFNMEAHGYETNSLLRMGITENGNYIQVHPTFLYESICTFIIFLILFFNRNKRKFSGQITIWYFLMYGVARTVIEYIRTDSLMIGNVKISQLISILLVLVSVIILIMNKIKRKKNEN